MTNTVYGLHNGDGVIRYVGVTVNPQQRLYKHRGSAQTRSLRANGWNVPFADWLDANQPVQMVFLEENVPDEYRYACEEFWSRVIPDLLNVMKGRRMPTGENSKLWGRFDGEKNPMYGRKQPFEVLRKISGENGSNARLTKEDVMNIRDRFAGGGVTQKDLAREYEVDPSHISNIILNKTWKEAAFV